MLQLRLNVGGAPDPRLDLHTAPPLNSLRGTDLPQDHLHRLDPMTPEVDRAKAAAGSSVSYLVVSN
jgi:hypothetical protein